jgi:hypothetical protein
VGLVLSLSLRLSNRGKCLTREELDLGLKTDQRTFEKVAAEYNKIDIASYDDIQFPEFTVTGSKNLPSNFNPISWEDAKKATKDCLRLSPKPSKTTSNNDISIDGFNAPRRTLALLMIHLDVKMVDKHSEGIDRHVISMLKFASLVETLGYMFVPRTVATNFTIFGHGLAEGLGNKIFHHLFLCVVDIRE